MHDEPPSHADTLTRPAPSADEIMRACIERTDALLAAATDAASPDTILFAKLIAARETRDELPLLGLSRAQTAGLFQRHFARCAPPAAAAHVGTIAVSPVAHATFVTQLRSLLLHDASASVSSDDAQCLSSIIAHACLRPDHLWRDLGLSGREEVSAMLDRYFPDLAARNINYLRWKKFLAQQLALSLGNEPGPAPGCPGCEDFTFCFPPAP